MNNPMIRIKICMALLHKGFTRIKELRNPRKGDGKNFSVVTFYCPNKITILKSVLRYSF